MIRQKTKRYSIEIDEERGCVTSLCVKGTEYIGRHHEAFFRIQIRDENLMTSIVADAFSGKLVKNIKIGETYCLTYGNFTFPELEVTVYIKLADGVVWDINIKENEGYYVEWIDFPRAAIPNDLRSKSGFSQVKWAFDEEKPKTGELHIQIDGQQTNFDYTSIPSLKEEYKKYFHIATAVEPRDLIHYKDLILTQFNELTTENRLKPTNIQPKEGVFSWTGADRIVEFAERHNMRLRGHGLAYEKIFPDWFFKNEDGSQASKERVMERLETHIKTIVARYKGRIHSYDVVNEVFGHVDWDTRDITRICGIGFVPLVYKWVHEVDPDAILILNDNYHEIPQKRENIFKWVKKWRDEGAPIHGVGFQDHLFLDTPIEAVDETLKLFSSIPDLKLYVTELDIAAYGFGDTTSRYPDYMTDEVKELVAEKYGALFDVYRKYSDHIETVGFWNVCGKRTWLDEYYVKGRKHYPLPFGYSGEPTEAFYSMIDFDKKLPRWTKNTKLPIIRNNNWSVDGNTDIITVKGCNNNGRYETIDVKLFSNFGEKKLICSFTDDIGSEYEYKMSLTKGVIYNGETSPDYILEVTGDDGIVKRDYFTYYTKAWSKKYYTITDDFRDFSKVRRYENCVLAENGVMPLWFWGNGSFGSASIVYNIPDGFDLKDFKVRICNTDDKFYNILVSVDDEVYEDAEMKWELEDKKDNAKYYSGTMTNVHGKIRYIKIDLSTGFPSYWCEYKARLLGAEVTTAISARA